MTDVVDPLAAAAMVAVLVCGLVPTRRSARGRTIPTDEAGPR